MSEIESTVLFVKLNNFNFCICLRNVTIYCLCDGYMISFVEIHSVYK